MGWATNFLDFGEGAISSTGWGDGEYAADVCFDRDDKPTQVTITFMQDEDDDDRDYDEEED